MGAGLGFSTTLSTLYIMEVATPQMRSGLAVVPAVAGTLGVLYCQVKILINGLNKLIHNKLIASYWGHCWSGSRWAWCSPATTRPSSSCCSSSLRRRCICWARNRLVNSMWDSTMYRVAHLLANQGCIDIDFGCSTFLLGQQESYSCGHQPGEIPKSKSTQPRFPRRWATLYSAFQIVWQCLG